MRENAKTSMARGLRRNESFAEKRLWEQLRNRQLANVKFLRQAPVGPYIADFLCRERLFIVEVDGATHSTDIELAHDAARMGFLESKGYRIIRLHNDEIINGMDEALTLISEALSRRG